MKNCRFINLLFLVYISVFDPPFLVSQNLKMQSVRIWDGEKNYFGKISDIEVQKGVIKSIRPSVHQKTSPVRFLLPGFCDASVTLGANAFGGATTREMLPDYLLGFLATGFSHVESLADPDLQNLRAEMLKGKLTGPFILQAQKPMLFSGFFSEGENPANQYQLIRGSEQNIVPELHPEGRTKHLPVFLKRSGIFSFSQSDLFRLRLSLEKLGYTPIIYSFTDPLSWEDALDSGYEIVFHALPPNASLDKIQTRNFIWSPMLNVSYLQSLKKDPKTLKKKMTELSKVHPVFKERFLASFIANLPEASDKEGASRDYVAFSNLWQSLYAFPKERLVFGSGSGHYGSFPGLGAILEAELWLATWKRENSVLVLSDQERSTPSFWQKLLGYFSPKEREILPPKSDVPTREVDRIALVKILTEKTCRFIGADHAGLIKEGGPAHFSVYKENPLKLPLGIFAIESMVLGGKLVYTPKPEKVGKKP